MCVHGHEGPDTEISNGLGSPDSVDEIGQLDAGPKTRSQSIRNLGALVVALVLAVLGWVVFIRSDSGPIDGSADSAQEFADSFPSDFACEEFAADPDGIQMSCSDPAFAYFWYPDPSRAGEISLEFDQRDGCAVVSGHAVATVTVVALPQDPVYQDLSDSFSSETNFVGRDCPRQ